MDWPAADDREQCQLEITDTLEQPVECSLIGEQAGVIWYGEVGQIFAYNALNLNIRPIKITQTDIEHKNNISNSLEFHVSFVMKTKPAPNWSDGPSKCYFILKDRKTIVAVRLSTCIQHASAPVALGHAENTDRSVFSFNMFSIHTGQDLPGYAPAVLLPEGAMFPVAVPVLPCVTVRQQNGQEDDVKKGAECGKSGGQAPGKGERNFGT